MAKTVGISRSLTCEKSSKFLFKFSTLLNSKTEKTPDVIVVVADVENLKRNLLLFSQIKDLEIPTILAINMADQMKRKGITIDLKLLKKELSNEVVLLSVRKDPDLGIKEVKKAIIKTYN